ncbi:MAG: flagellar biosynthesis regulator FlhF [Phenylobacterium zucineum]|nr:MAG: flagellar biosynthesis regulator FlhF [Phenylobacterium zucineum]
MSLRAYQQNSARSESLRQTEYRLFAEVTMALISASKLDRIDFAGRMDALDWNRRMWSVLGADCASPDNQLPKEARASIISLSRWVGQYTSEVMTGREDIQDLIDVNRIIMQGLASGGGTP